MAENTEQTITFYCSLIDKEISHTINPLFLRHHKKYPFPYILHHKDPVSKKKIFTILYLDKNFQVVKQTSKYLEDEKDHPLINEILQLENDFKRLYTKYQTSISDLRQKIKNLKDEELIET